MKIAIASDHAGFPLKQHIVAFLQEKGYEVMDLGVDTDQVRSDYTEAAQKVGHTVAKQEAERGILICGSGVGASVAANKIKGIYCAITHDAYSAAQGVQHDNMNVMAMGSRVVGIAVAESLVEAYLGASFDTETPRYMRRFQQLQDIEDKGW